jgi:hypothetical protein
LEGNNVDFLWTSQGGHEVISTKADAKSYPVINNQEEVRGSVVEVVGQWMEFWIPKSITQYVADYKFTKEGGFELNGEFTKSNKIRAFQSINDKGDYIYAYDPDLYASGVTIADLHNGETIIIGRYDAVDLNYYLFSYGVAINNNSQILVSRLMKGEKGLDELYLYNTETESKSIIASGFPYYGIDLNDKGVVVARNKEGTEGFIGSVKSGLSSVGEFIPQALNNNGDIVGNKLDGSLWVSHEDGTMISIDETVDFGDLNVTQITKAWDINDNGEILVTVTIDGRSHALVLSPVALKAE